MHAQTPIILTPHLGVRHLEEFDNGYSRRLLKGWTVIDIVYFWCIFGP